MRSRSFAPMPLLEREPHLKELHQALADATAKRGRTVLVTGEAGIGKTALVERFTREAESAARILWGACEALFTPRPLGPFYDMVNALGGPLLARLEGNARPVDLFHGLLDAIRHHDGPSILVLEDLHWADHGTLDFIRFVARRIDRTPGLLLLTFRDDEIGAEHPLTAMLGELPVAARLRLKLPTLSRATVEALAREAGRAADAIYLITRGNPFFVTELLAEDDGVIAPSVREAVLARARHLSEPAREILELVSVVPDRVELPLLRQARESDLSELEECIQRGLLGMEAGSAFFRHELARLAIQDSLSALKRTRLNKRILTSLAARGDTDPATLTRLAHHAIAAEDTESITRYGPRAAGAASARGAFREAATLLTAVMPYAKLLAPRERAAFLEQCAQNYFAVGTATEAITASGAAHAIWRELGDSLAEARNLVHRCEFLLWGRITHPAEAAKVAREAIALLERSDTTRGERGSTDELALAHSALALALSRDDKAAAAHSRATASRLVPDSTNRDVRIKALSLITMAEYMSTGSPNLENVAALMKDARAARDDLGVLAAYTRHVWAFARSRELAALEQSIESGQAFAADRQLDGSQLSHVLLRGRADALAARGRWDDAQAQYQRMASLPNAPAAVRLTYCESQLELIKARRGGSFDVSRLDEVRRGPIQYRSDEYQLNRAIVELAWLGHRHDYARDAASVLSEVAADWDHPWVVGEAAFWSRAVGVESVPETQVAEPYALLFAGDSRGAAALWQRMDYPYEAGLALMMGDEASQRESIRVFESLGAQGTAERVRDHMREQGIRGIPQGPRNATKSNVAGLTERELEILELLAAGLSNAEMAKHLHRSVRTVEHHVAALTDKLGVDSRQAAIARARQRGLLKS